MLRRLIRTLLMGGMTEIIGPRWMTKIERSVVGSKAVSVRAHVAHRSMMVQLFKALKAGKKN